MPILVSITFGLYFILLLIIGFYAYRRASHVDDFFLGGRKLGKWVTAISAQASDMSGWLLMGLPGAVYAQGFSALWIIVGLFGGTYANWKLVAQRLRVYTAKLDAITIPIFFEKRFNDSTGMLRILSALIMLFFFTIYVSSGFVASGKLFQEIFGIDYQLAVLIGGGAIVAYTFMGGFFAVSWTDLMQGMIMICGILITIVGSYYVLYQCTSTLHPWAQSNFGLNILPQGKFPLFSVISLLGWGLGYFGQPHILVRFMSINSARNIPSARKIAIWWLLCSLFGSFIIGLHASTLLPGLSSGMEEKVYIYLTRMLFPPIITGILLSALLSAIMSTADSQLLVCSSSITEDIFLNFSKMNMLEKNQLILGRLSVFLISAIAVLFAINPSSTVFGIVSYAWGGFGAAFGPLVLCALFSRRTTHFAALSGMIVGTAVLVIWKMSGLSEILYEIIPGFFANLVVIVVINAFAPQKNESILKLHEEVVKETKF